MGTVISLKKLGFSSDLIAKKLLLDRSNFANREMKNTDSENDKSNTDENKAKTRKNKKVVVDTFENDDVLFPLPSVRKEQVLLLLLKRIREVQFYSAVSGEKFNKFSSVAMGVENARNEKFNMLDETEKIINAVNELPLKYEDEYAKLPAEIYDVVSCFPYYCDAICEYNDIKEGNKSENNIIIPKIKHFGPGKIITDKTVFSEISRLVEKSFRKEHPENKQSPDKIKTKNLFLFIEGPETSQLELLLENLDFLKKHLTVNVYIHNTEAVTELCLQNIIGHLTDFAGFSVKTAEADACFSNSRILVLLEDKWAVSVDCFRDFCYGEYFDDVKHIESIKSFLESKAFKIDVFSEIMNSGLPPTKIDKENEDYFFVISRGINPLFMSVSDYENIMTTLKKKKKINEAQFDEKLERFKKRHNEFLDLFKNKAFCYHEIIVNDAYVNSINNDMKRITVSCFIGDEELFPFVSKPKTAEPDVAKRILAGYYNIRDEYGFFSCRFVPERKKFMNCIRAEITNNTFNFYKENSIKSSANTEKTECDGKNDKTVNYHLKKEGESSFYKAMKSLFKSKWEGFDYQLMGDINKGDAIDTSQKIRNLFIDMQILKEGKENE